MLKIYIYIGINAHVTFVDGRTESEDRAILKQNSQLRRRETENFWVKRTLKHFWLKKDPKTATGEMSQAILSIITFKVMIVQITMMITKLSITR